MDYWYAYNLLRYRIENPLSNGIYEPKELPMEYYSFLDNLVEFSEEQEVQKDNVKAKFIDDLWYIQLKLIKAKI